jgi:superfamily II DNA or RNA helicase
MSKESGTIRAKEPMTNKESTNKESTNKESTNKELTNKGSTNKGSTNKESKITNKGYSILTNSLSDKEREELFKSLTARPIVFSDYNGANDNSFPVYRESDTRIYMPKFYGLAHYGPAKISRKEGTSITPEFEGSLKDHQVSFCERILGEINNKGSCIAHSATGSGKTTMALWIATQIKKKTLIVVHKEFLLNQWLERINQFIKGAKVGIIQRSRCDIDCDIIVGMIQTMNNKDYDYSSIGLIIIDEAHHMAAQGFSNLFYKVCPLKTLALSATPTRVDGLTKVLRWFCGDILTNDVLSEVQVPTVEFVSVSYSSEITPKFNYKGTLNNADLINQLIRDPARNKQIIEKIVELHAMGRKILVLSGRRGHCESLCTSISRLGIDAGLYLGGMSNDELDTTNARQVIFGTYNMVAEAYDNPTLDSLIMATGISSVQQSIGRILRRKNALEPLVVDFVDGEFLGNQARRRRQFYKKSGYNLIDRKKEVKIAKIVFEECMF